jgi:hypothetical protein
MYVVENLEIVGLAPCVFKFWCSGTLLKIWDQ